MKLLKQVLLVFFVVIALGIFISFNYLFVYNYNHANIMFSLLAVVLFAGLVLAFVMRRYILIPWALLADYFIIMIYAILFSSTGAFVSNDCGLFCFAPILVLIQYLAVLPVFSIPLFILATSQREISQRKRWRDNYILLTGAIYFVIVVIIYGFFRR